MKREQLEKLAEPVFRNIEEVMNKIKKVIETKKINIHSIELVGGGTRIPAFIGIIKQIFGVEPSRTLNSS